MKKIYLIVLILCISANIFALDTKVENAKDGSGQPLNLTIDTRGSTLPYISTQNSYIPAGYVIDFYSSAGRFASAGYFINDDVSISATVNFSINGTTYGQDIIVKPNEVLIFDNWQVFKKMKISAVSTANFRAVIR